MPDDAATTANTTTHTPSSLLQYLPELYRGDAFLGQFLLAFELILLGPSESFKKEEPGLLEMLEQPGLEETIAGVAEYFDASETPSEFVTWLSSWVALTFRADLDEVRRRDFISKAVWLYRLRGTKKGLEEAVRVYTRLGPVIDEQFARLQVGVNSTVGVDTYLGGGVPFFFRVRIRLPTIDAEQLGRQGRVIRDIIDMEKPAHTHYTLEMETPSMRLGVNSTVGVDTLLGLTED